VSHLRERSRIEPVQADAERIRAHLEEFAALSEPDSGEGVTRLGYSALERTAHARFAAHFAELGLTCTTDAAGNSIAVLPGTDPALPALGTGSHLDSVPNGGRFDGIAGVVAAMELGRLLLEAPTRPRHPVRFVVFANEEGARFGQACIGSRLIAGLTARDDLDRLQDRNGTTVAEAMRGVGIDPERVHEARWSAGELAAFIELHIEQGGVLETEGRAVGIVEVISGSTRIAIDVEGTASHTGGTPMHHRADALTAAAAIVLGVEAIANDDRHRGTRMTVGKLDVQPGSITTIPGRCRVYVDVRDIDNQRQREAANEVIAFAYEVARGRGVKVSTELLADTSPVTLPVGIRNVLVAAATDLGLDYRVLFSGASHDAQMIERVCPTGMIFVPSLNAGVSHAPAELSRAEDIARGTDLLAEALLRLDGATAAGGDR
jgi:hydantoinase/carbamoylase family amidase